MRLLDWLLRRWGGEYFALAQARRQAAVGDVKALQRLAQDALTRSKFDAAERLIEQAIASKPGDASLWVTRAAIARRRDDFTSARAALAEALRLTPNHAPALTNLAEIELLHGRAEAALRLLDAALARAPKLLPARVNRVAALSETGRHEEARALGEKLLAEYPDHPELLLNTANALLQLGRSREAIRLLRQALRCRPSFPEAEFLLASLVGDADALRDAIDYLEKRLAREGDVPSLLTMLASAHQAAGHLSRAAELASRLLAREPQHLGARLVLAERLSASGHAPACDRLYGELFEQSAELPGLASNWLFEGNYLLHLSPEELFARHRRWARTFNEAPVTLAPCRHDGPLRVGYVSGDFFRHPVGHLLLAIVKLHDRQAVEPIAFSTALREDELTRELKGAFAAWHEVFDASDDELLARMRAEKIDILVDLSGHTAFHRLRVFARRAAPVQVTWIGYFHSTGLENIDYLLTDPYTSPPEVGQHFSETPIHLGSTRFCFFPPPYAPSVALPPVLRGHPFTFGCFNRLAKLNDEVIAAWSEILHQAPHSRLWLKAGALADAWVRQDVLERFRAQGIHGHRLVLRGSSGHAAMLEEFEMVDLCLDPLPFTGGATSLEAFWMGVPTLTVPGATMVSRQTHAMNVNLGLADRFSSSGVRDYIERAVALANDPRPLWPLRAHLRPRMVQSPLCDDQTFTRRLERFYRSAHEAALAGEKLPAYLQMQ